MLIAGLGIIFFYDRNFFVKISDASEDTTAKVQKALNLGNWEVSFSRLFFLFSCRLSLPENMSLRGFDFTKIGVFGAIMVGLVVGTLISFITEYYTSMGKKTSEKYYQPIFYRTCY